jgi:hypothetical protein
MLDTWQRTAAALDRRIADLDGALRNLTRALRTITKALCTDTSSERSPKWTASYRRAAAAGRT